MTPRYALRRVFCSTPGDLELERRAFHDVLGAVNEREGLHRGTLLVPVSCVGAAVLGYFNEAVRENVRKSAGFIQVLGASWGAPLADFEGHLNLALACRDDGALPMRDVAVFLKHVPAARCEPAVVEVRERLALTPGVHLYAFGDLETFRQTLDHVLTQWLTGGHG